MPSVLHQDGIRSSRGTEKLPTSPRAPSTCSSSPKRSLCPVPRACAPPTIAPRQRRWPQLLRCYFVASASRLILKLPPRRNSWTTSMGPRSRNTKSSRRTDTHRGGEWSSEKIRNLQDRRTPSPDSSITCRATSVSQTVPCKFSRSTPSYSFITIIPILLVARDGANIINNFNNQHFLFLHQHEDGLAPGRILHTKRSTHSPPTLVAHRHLRYKDLLYKRF